jgi:hypothetical protein
MSDEILIDAVKTLDSKVAEWQDSPDDHLPESLEDAINTCCAVICGNVPSHLTQQLYNAGLFFAAAWQDVLNGNVASNGEPGKQFWETLQVLRNQLIVIDEPPVVDQRTVAEMLEDYDQDWPGRFEQIAKDFGRYNSDTGRWSGPFFNSHGGFLEHKVRQEAKEPGSVLGPDWVHPTILAKREAATKQAEARLKQIQSGLFVEKKPTVDKTPIDQQLREGQYPDVIAKHSGVTIQQVLAIAKEHGIVPADRDADLEAMGKLDKSPDAKPDERIPTPKAAEPKQGELIDDSPDFEDDEFGDEYLDDTAVITLTPIEGDELKDFIHGFAETFADAVETISQIDVMSALTSAGYEAKPRAVGQVLRHLKG